MKTVCICNSFTELKVLLLNLKQAHLYLPQAWLVSKKQLPLISFLHYNILKFTTKLYFLTIKLTYYIVLQLVILLITTTVNTFNSMHKGTSEFQKYEFQKWHPTARVSVNYQN